MRDSGGHKVRRRWQGAPARGRRVALVALVALFTSAAASIAAPPKPVFCHPSGDYCVGAPRLHGVRTLVVKIFNRRGRVRACVTHRGRTDCHRFRLKPSRRWSDIDQFVRPFWGYFPERGPGRYYVRFSLPGRWGYLGTVSFVMGMH
jgi:hypothetical protein